MDILDGTGSAHDVQDHRFEPQGRARPDVVNIERGDSIFVLQANTGESVEQCFEGLLEFWNTHVVGSKMEKIRGFPAVDARAGDIQRTAAFILADPRCVLKNGIPIPSDKLIFDTLFDETVTAKTEGATVQAAYRLHCRLARLVFVEVKLVLEMTNRMLHAAGAWQSEEGQRNLAEEQQAQIQSLVTRSLEQMQLAATYGALYQHPSIIFLYGWLCYKSGTGPHLLRAITMLTDAGKRALLRATCGILRALSRFYIIWEAQEALMREYVIADLQESLNVAGRSEEHDVVETPLLIEAHSALAVLFFSSWEDEEDQHRGVMREVQHLRARRHCMDAHRLYHMWKGAKLPSRLLLRASRLCKMDPPGSMDWLQTDHMLSRITYKWRKKHGGLPDNVDRDMRRIQMGKGASRSQLAGYETFAILLPPPDAEVISKVEVEAVRWKKTKQSLELRKQPPKRICQLCGASAAIPCNRCKLVLYCSNACAHFDRIAGAHALICIGKGE